MTGSPRAERRILSFWCPDLSLDRWRQMHGCGAGEGADAVPVVLFADTAHGPRIAAANAAAAAGGARRGMMLADARTLCPAIRAVPADPTGDRAMLEKLALWARRWGPWSALDPPDGVMVDVTGAAHLFGGERALLEDVRRRCGRRGFGVRAALAPTAGAAWALARHGADGAVIAAGEEPMRWLADLPVAALRLDEDVLIVLRRLGFRTLGELAAAAGAPGGRSAVHRRFRNRRSAAANPLIRLDQLLGRVPEPLLPIAPPHQPLVQRRLLEPLRHRELLDQVIDDLAGDLVRVLAERGQGARRLELGLWRVDGDVVARPLELAAATRDPAHIARLFRMRLDDVDAGFGIELVRLRSTWTESLASAQADLERQADTLGTSLAACVDRLVARLGPHAVRRPVPAASHLPERAQKWVPPLDSGMVEQGQLRFHARPLRLLEQPEQIAVLYATPDGYPRRFRWRGRVHEVTRVEGPERIAPEWWREKGTARLRDYYRIEDGEGRRYWIYRQGLIGDGRGGVPDWFLQGLWG
ncbi:DNA polymerase Y family protein [Erythrobacteraceae bacterium CFH 75059]|uniref:DUF6504 family protein n=1 Tax=Qipengyuania thermophila TaxID=2509361 RepID=UPI00101E9AF1|nr:DUF6504 family protein [Qipengyuania thermophila]TCD05093.1 DNA polymerase Y family protein [Erythrobacteraceae bacterium CFH 75059]